MSFANRTTRLCALIFSFLTCFSAQATRAAVFACADVGCLISTMQMLGQDDTDIIQLAAGTYTLTDLISASRGSTGLPEVNSELIIRGAGRDQTIIERSAAALPFRVFTNANGVVALENLTIRGGNTLEGGGVYNDAIMTISNCHITGNMASEGGGIYTGGSALRLSNSIVSNNMSVEGGGIINRGILVVTDSSILDNTAAVEGGGLHNGGEGSIWRSTIAGNSAGMGDGGGVYNSGELMIANTTFATNQAGKGGGLHNGGEIVLTHNTFADNTGAEAGGGLWNSGEMTLQNVIAARNLAPTGPDCVGGGDTVSFDHNLIGSAAGCANLTSLPNDLVAEPGLGVFTASPEPGRGHIPLLSGSPAIGAGNPAVCPPVDQLGEQRQASCDIGAVAAPAPTP